METRGAGAALPVARFEPATPTCSMPGFSTLYSGLVSMCSGTSWQPMRGNSCQRCRTARAMCSSSTAGGKVTSMTGSGAMAYLPRNSRNKFQEYSRGTTGACGLTLGAEAALEVVVLEEESPPAHLHLAVGVDWWLQLAVLAQLREDLRRLHGVTPLVVARAAAARAAPGEIRGLWGGRHSRPLPDRATKSYLF